jgi:hypothetical protein
MVSYILQNNLIFDFNVILKIKLLFFKRKCISRGKSGSLIMLPHLRE